VTASTAIGSATVMTSRPRPIPDDELRLIRFRAKSTDRSQLQNLLTYCRLNKGRVHFVVVFNPTRFARDKYDHFAPRSHLQSLGISLRSATEPIDDTSTGKLMERGGRLRAVRQRRSVGSHACRACERHSNWDMERSLNAPRAVGKSLMADPERGWCGVSAIDPG
jgi:hypothetical protein